MTTNYRSQEEAAKNQWKCVVRQRCALCFRGDQRRKSQREGKKNTDLVTLRAARRAPSEEAERTETPPEAEETVGRPPQLPRCMIPSAIGPAPLLAGPSLYK